MNISRDSRKTPLWASRWLRAAGIYNMAWGALAITCPDLLFDLASAERINYPEIWQCVDRADDFAIPNRSLLAARDRATTPLQDVAEHDREGPISCDGKRQRKVSA